MSNGLTRRSRTWGARRELDREAKRNFVYFLLDAHGAPLYIGRSSNVRSRIRKHYGEASAEVETHDIYRKRDWFFQVRSVSLLGPFNWDEAIKRERAEIERHQPIGNVGLTARDHRPAVAYRSAARAGGAS